MPRYELKQGSLFRDGQPIQCRLNGPIAAPDKIQPGKINIVYSPCSEQCALFELFAPELETKMPAQVVLHCGSGKRVISPVEVHRSQNPKAN